MRKSLLTAGIGALVLAAGTAPATAASAPGWRVTYVSQDTGYDDFGLYDVAATGAHDAWAVGSTMQGAGGAGAVLRWNGNAWSTVTVPGSTGSFDSVAGSSPNDVWLAGVTAHGANTAWHWNGSSWSSTSTGAYSTADVSVLSPSDAWAVGNDDEGNEQPGKALHWNGSSWQAVTMPLTARKVAAVSASDVWAVGEDGDQPAAMHWNGATWKTSVLPEVPIPEGENGFSYFNDVVAISSDNVWAVGRLYWGGGEELRAAEAEHNSAVLMHWNGHKWSLQVGPDGAFALSAGQDGRGGIWYSTDVHTLVHVTRSGTSTTVPAPTVTGREAPGFRQLAGVPGGTTVLGVGEIAPVPGSGDESWDAFVAQYH